MIRNHTVRGVRYDNSNTQEPSMRRSVHVFAPLLASTAIALGSTGCHKAEPQRCVDEQNHVVDPKFCDNLPPGALSSGTPGNNGGYYGHGGIWIPHLYRNYYGGLGGYALGSIVSGGAYTPQPGHTYSAGGSRGVSSSGTSRGGFGSSFSGSSGSGGE
jgi:hypothetical protein